MQPEDINSCMTSTNVPPGDCRLLGPFSQKVKSNIIHKKGMTWWRREDYNNNVGDVKITSKIKYIDKIYIDVEIKNLGVKKIINTFAPQFINQKHFKR